MLTRITEADSPVELRNARKAVFDHTSLEQLRELKTSPYNAVALYAAWQEMVRDSTVYLKRENAEHFLGFVEGRLMVRVPEWWQTTLLSAKEFGSDGPPHFTPADWKNVYRGAGVELIQNTAQLQEWVDGRWEKRSPLKMEPRASVNANFRRQEQNLIVTVNGASVSVPKRVLEKEYFEQLDVLLDGRRCYLALQGSGGVEFFLLCFDESNGTVWRARVWSEAIRLSPVAYGPEQRVALVHDSKRIIVFGATPEAMFIEAFDKITGKNLFRFSSWYSETLAIPGADGFTDATELGGQHLGSEEAPVKTGGE